jgi:hypothetical protein
MPYQALGACFNTYISFFNWQTGVFLSSIFKSIFPITLYQSSTLAQLQLNHVLALCAFCKALIYLTVWEYVLYSLCNYSFWN